jgi:hypothetical protein
MVLITISISDACEAAAVTLHWLLRKSNEKESRWSINPISWDLKLICAALLHIYCTLLDPECRSSLGQLDKIHPFYARTYSKADNNIFQDHVLHVIKMELELHST